MQGDRTSMVQPLTETYGYGSGHTAPVHSEGVRDTLDNMDDIMPDYLAHPGWYGGGMMDDAEVEAHTKASRARGNPDRKVWIYRAVPHGITKIYGRNDLAERFPDQDPNNLAEWVTTSKKYAQQHARAESCPKCGGNMQVIGARVRAGDLANEGYPTEFGYFGDDTLEHAGSNRIYKTKCPAPRKKPETDEEYDARMAQEYPDGDRYHQAFGSVHQAMPYYYTDKESVDPEGWTGIPGYEDDDLALQYQKGHNGNHFIQAVRKDEDNRHVGLLHWDGDNGDIHEVSVSPTHRGAGIGAWMLEAARGLAAQHDDWNDEDNYIPEPQHTIHNLSSDPHENNSMNTGVEFVRRDMRDNPWANSRHDMETFEDLYGPIHKKPGERRLGKVAAQALIEHGEPAVFNFDQQQPVLAHNGIYYYYNHNEGRNREDNWHSISAVDPNGNKFIGALDWDANDGYIGGVATHENYRRRGVATKMYELARTMPGTPQPKHSGLSPDGRAWRESLREKYGMASENWVDNELGSGRVITAALEHDPNEGTWEFPGGKLDPGENAKQAAIREFREEVGQDLPPGVFVGAWLSPGGIVVSASVQKEAFISRFRDFGDKVADALDNNKEFVQQYSPRREYQGHNPAKQIRFHARPVTPSPEGYPSRENTGWMQYSEAKPFHDDAPNTDYVLSSFATPIAWHVKDDGHGDRWRLPPTEYKSTVTGGDQSGVGWLLKDGGHNISSEFDEPEDQASRDQNWDISGETPEHDMWAYLRTKEPRHDPGQTPYVQSFKDANGNWTHHDWGTISAAGNVFKMGTSDDLDDAQIRAQRAYATDAYHANSFEKPKNRLRPAIMKHHARKSLDLAVHKDDEAGEIMHTPEEYDEAIHLGNDGKYDYHYLAPDWFANRKSRDVIDEPADYQPYDTLHHVIASVRNSDGSGMKVGDLHWSPVTGEILSLVVHPYLRRQGIANHMYDYAKDLSFGGDVAYPLHSQDQTYSGVKWADQAGGPYHHPFEKDAAAGPVYKGFIYLIEHERDIDLGNREHANPDDPDGDMSEQSAWWDIEDAKNNPALREECKSVPWDELAMWADKSVRANKEIKEAFAKLAAPLVEDVAARRAIKQGPALDPNEDHQSRYLTVGGKRFYQKQFSNHGRQRPQDVEDARRAADSEYFGSLMRRSIGINAAHNIRSPRSDDPPYTIYSEVAPKLNDRHTLNRGYNGATETDQGILTGLGDMLSVEGDRRANNWKELPNGEPYVWDFSYSDPGKIEGLSPSQNRWGQVYSDFAHHYMDDYVHTGRGRLGENPLSPGSDVPRIEAALQSLRPEYERAGRGDWHDELMDRWNEIKQHAAGGEFSSVLGDKVLPHERGVAKTAMPLPHYHEYSDEADDPYEDGVLDPEGWRNVGRRTQYGAKPVDGINEPYYQLQYQRGANDDHFIQAIEPKTGREHAMMWWSGEDGNIADIGSLRSGLADVLIDRAKSLSAKYGWQSPKHSRNLSGRGASWVSKRISGGRNDDELYDPESYRRWFSGYHGRYLAKTAMPRDQDYLDSLSFEDYPISPNRYNLYPDEHQLVAHDYEGAEHGHLFWRPSTGVITSIETVDNGVRQGLGTELLRRGKQIAQKNGWAPLRHSVVLTDDGKKLVQGIGDERGGPVLQHEAAAPGPSVYPALRELISAGKPEYTIRTLGEVPGHQHDAISDNTSPEYHQEEAYDPSAGHVYALRTNGGGFTFLAPVRHNQTGETGWLRGNSGSHPDQWHFYPEKQFGNAVAGNGAGSGSPGVAYRHQPKGERPPKLPGTVGRPRKDPALTTGPSKADLRYTRQRATGYPAEQQEGDVPLDEEGHQLVEPRRDTWHDLGVMRGFAEDEPEEEEEDKPWKNADWRDLPEPGFVKEYNPEKRLPPVAGSWWEYEEA